VENQHVSVTRFFHEQRALLASLLLFGLFLVELALLHRFTLYDLMVYDWMQEYRSCALDRVAARLDDLWKQSLDRQSCFGQNRLGPFYGSRSLCAPNQP